MKITNTVTVLVLCALLGSVLYAKRAISQSLPLQQAAPKVTSFSFKNPKGKTVIISSWRDGNTQCTTATADNNYDNNPVSISCVKF